MHAVSVSLLPLQALLLLLLIVFVVWCQAQCHLPRKYSFMASRSVLLASTGSALPSARAQACAEASRWLAMPHRPPPAPPQLARACHEKFAGRTQDKPPQQNTPACMHAQTHRCRCRSCAARRSTSRRRPRQPRPPRPRGPPQSAAWQQGRNAAPGSVGQLKALGVAAGGTTKRKPRARAEGEKGPGCLLSRGACQQAGPERGAEMPGAPPTAAPDRRPGISVPVPGIFFHSSPDFWPAGRPIEGPAAAVLRPARRRRRRQAPGRCLGRRRRAPCMHGHARAPPAGAVAWCQPGARNKFSAESGPTGCIARHAGMCCKRASCGGGARARPRPLRRRSTWHRACVGAGTCRG